MCEVMFILTSIMDAIYFNRSNDRKLWNRVYLFIYQVFVILAIIGFYKN